MQKFSLILVLFIFFQITPLPRILAHASSISQSFCTKQIHNDLENSEIIEAYLCGDDLSEGPIKEIFIKLSLYHLVVISASHLSFLTSVLQIFNIQKKWVVAATLIAFGILTGLQPPIVRALIIILLSIYSNFFRLQWRNHWQIIFSLLIAVSLFPKWIDSQSLLLSMGTGLALCFAQFSKSTWLKALTTYIILLPLLTGWAQLHPIGILFNLFLAPILVGILWLFSGIWLLFPVFANSGLNILMKVLREFSNLAPLETGSKTLNINIKWIYIFLLITCLHFVSVKRERALS
jgi:ComEC/Rec2-related protein